MKSLLIIAAACLVLAGMANGVMDTLQFHFASQQVISQESLYWNPAKSWVLKYKLNEEGRPLRPLQAAFPGSTTVFSFLTDGWHMMKFLYHGLLRLALVFMIAAALRTWRIRAPWWVWAIVWIALAGVQAAGFHFTYTIIF